MKLRRTWPLLAVVLVSGGSAFAATKTVTLSVPGMNCAACPITVKKALSKVPGVAKIDVDLDARQATVTFDDATTRVEALLRATREAGYPATVREGPK
jgi:mercuric ion binding protein